jgi:hypothetical protein
VITTDDRAVIQTAIPPGSNQPDHVLSELERLLGKPGCPACRYLAEVERSFFSWFQIESFSSPAVQAQLRAAQGMCPVHSRRLIEDLGEGHIMTTVAREALAGALQHVTADAPAGACPACEVLGAGARRASNLVLDGLRDPAMVRLYSEHGGMCLPHVLQALAAEDVPVLKVLAERLLANLYDGVGRSLVMVLAGSDDDAPRRARSRSRLPELPIRDSTVGHLHGLLDIEACPVCLSTGVAEHDYLRWFEARAAEGDQSLRSDPGEFCALHLHDAAALATPSAVECAVELKRAAKIAHLKRFLARLTQLPASGRRGKRSTPDGLHQLRGELLATPYCAACNARDGLERSRFDLVAAGVSLAPVRERYETCHGLCVRHALQVPEGHAARVVRRHLDGRLSVLAWEVGEVARKYAWAFRHETSGPERDGWLRALAQIDGRVFAGAPAP